MTGEAVYLDYQATTPVDPAVVEAMLPYLTAEFGNPSSAHRYGRRAAWAVADAREQVAALIGARPDEIVFTSSGTESNALALVGATRALREKGSHVVTTAVEHPSVLATCRRLAESGIAVTRLPVDEDGRVCPDAVANAIEPRTVLVSVMHANNEIGTLQPITEISEVTRRRGVLLHVDAAQSAASVPVDVDTLGADLLTVVGHKMYAPKGVAALYVRRGVRLVPQLLGGGQEHRRRAATENVAGIVALGRAAGLVQELGTVEPIRLRDLRERLRMLLLAALPHAWVNGSLRHRLPGNLSVTIPGLDAARLLAVLPDLALSTGAACHSGAATPSHVLTAIGLSPAEAAATIRIGMGRHTTEAHVIRAAVRLTTEALNLARGCLTTPM